MPEAPAAAAEAPSSTPKPSASTTPPPAAATQNGGGGGGSGRISETVTSADQSSRTIVTLMFVATAVTLVTHEAKGTKSTVGGAKILLGFTIGSASLILLSKAGGPGRSFAVGLAGTAALGSLLVNGQDLAKIVNNLTGTKSTVAAPPTTATAPTSAPAVATAPTTKTTATKAA